MTWTSILLHCLLLYPVYQVLGTIRHELAHALAAVLQGVKVLEIRVFPSRIDGNWYWGYVRFGGDTPLAWWVIAAPYLVNVLTIALGLAIIPWAAPFGAPHACLAAVMLCWVSPILDTLYNLCKWWLLDRGDFKQLADCLNDHA